MAKFEKQVHGDFDSILSLIHNAIMNGSVSASFEDSSYYSDGDFRCAVRVYERYSWFGNNRVSMSVTLAGSRGKYFLTAITSGGSQAVFLKLNTVGEESFLDTIADVVGRLG